MLVEKKENALQAIAIRDHTGKTDTELSFLQGETIEILEAREKDVYWVFLLFLFFSFQN